MKKNYRYRWFAFHLKVDCTRCGNNIVLQEFEGHPTCNECGHINKSNWLHEIKAANISSLKNGNGNIESILERMDASDILEPLEKISCFHCKTTLSFSPEDDLKNHHCNTCNKPLGFVEFPELEDLIFYKAGNTQTNNEEIKMIAVRCVSCGAPLQTDPSKSNFNCHFCNTENILPISLRYKVVLDDIFVGERMSKIPKLQAFVRDGQIVKQALRENGKESFTDTELDKVLINEKDDSAVYHQIINEFKYLPSDSILKEIFDTTKNGIVLQHVGLRLQKTPEEIKVRMSDISGKATENNQTVETPKPALKRKSRFKSPFFIILIIVFIITIFMMINSL